MVAELARQTIVAKQLGADALVTVNDEQIAASLTALRSDPATAPLIHEALRRALRHVAFRHAFCDLHVWYEGGFFSYSHERLMSRF